MIYLLRNGCTYRTGPQSSVSFSVLFNFNLFTNTITVWGVLSTLDNLIGKALGDTLAFSHSLLPDADAHKVE